MKGMKLRFFNCWETAAAAEASDVARQTPVERIRETVALILRTYGVTEDDLNRQRKKLHIKITTTEGNYNPE